MSLGFYVDLTRCIGCHTCQVACKDRHDLQSVGPRPRRVTTYECGTYPEVGLFHTVVSCNHCENPACVAGCPTGAMHKDDLGFVSVDHDKCVGCKYCIAACPYNVRYINSETKVADNCDFCLKTKLANGEEPACVQACRHGALYFGDVNDPQSIISRLLRVKDTVRIRPHLGTEPSLRYVTVQKEGV